MADLRNTRGVRRDPKQYVDQQEARDRGRRELGYALMLTPTKKFTALSVSRLALPWRLNLCDVSDASGGSFELFLPSVVGRHGAQLVVRSVVTSANTVSVTTHGDEIMEGLGSTNDFAVAVTLWLVADEPALTWWTLLNA